MELGLGSLGLAPSEFWRMTPRELAMAIAGRFGIALSPLDRAGLLRLMKQFPDALPLPSRERAGGANAEPG
jgi:uncharacterized phage protein (TIGR02216 family)